MAEEEKHHGKIPAAETQPSKLIRIRGIYARVSAKLMEMDAQLKRVEEKAANRGDQR